MPIPSGANKFIAPLVAQQVMQLKKNVSIIMHIMFACILGVGEGSCVWVWVGGLSVSVRERVLSKPIN